jgi:hypothetical protein
MVRIMHGTNGLLIYFRIVLLPFHNYAIWQGRLKFRSFIANPHPYQILFIVTHFVVIDHHIIDTSGNASCSLGSIVSRPDFVAPPVMLSPAYLFLAHGALFGGSGSHGDSGEHPHVAGGEGRAASGGVQAEGGGGARAGHRHL